MCWLYLSLVLMLWFHLVAGGVLFCFGCVCCVCVCARAVVFCGLYSITALGFRAGLCVDSGLWYYGRGSMYPYNPLFSQVPLKFTKVPL